MIRPLPNPVFINMLIAQIRGARKRIVIVNFLAQILEKSKKGDRIEKIVRALIAAIKRGVSLEVVLEGSKFDFNYNFYRRLKDAGANCWMDTSKTFIHTKAVLFDDKYLISGSHNLTDASMWGSEEFSILTDDKRTISSFKRGLRKILKQRETLRGRSCKKGKIFDETFLARVVHPMHRAHAENAFKLYLILMREDATLVSLRLCHNRVFSLFCHSCEGRNPVISISSGSLPAQG
ncbi:hypothetical protein KKA47_00250 [bacterium]|nr:hypothetical protein [bacterium]